MFPNILFGLRVLWRPLCWVIGHQPSEAPMPVAGMAWMVCRRCTLDWLEAA